MSRHDLGSAIVPGASVSGVVSACLSPSDIAAVGQDRIHIPAAFLGEMQVNTWEGCLNLFCFTLHWSLYLLRCILQKKKGILIVSLLESLVSRHELLPFSAHRCLLNRHEHIICNRESFSCPFKVV